MFSFGQPQFLFAAMGLAVPVILHLMKRQVAVNVTFPSIRFILKGRLPKTGRRRLRDVLLMVLRLLLLALLILALARLTWVPKTPQGAAADGAAAGSAVFLVDVSASMSGWQRMRQAKARINAIMSRDPSTAFGLVLSARGVEETLPLGTPSDELKTAVADLQPRPFEGDHVAGLEAAAAMLQDAGGGTLYVVSDLQVSDWSFSQPQQLPASVDLVFLTPEAVADGNVAIMNVRSETVPNGSTRVVVELQNHGSSDRTVTLRLSAGVTELTKRVDIPPRRPFRTAFVVQNLGTTQGEVTLDTDDGYTFDNRYAAWLGGEPPIRVLVVIPAEGEPDKENELFFLKKALQVQSPSASRPFSIQEVAANLLWSLQPHSQDALVLLGALAHLDEQGLEILKDYLSAGGVALSTPSRKSGRQFMRMRRQGLLDVDYRGVWSVENRYRDAAVIGWMNAESMLGNVFENPQETDLFFFPIYRLVQVRARDAATVLLRTEDGDPVLLEQDVGEGTFFVSTTGFTPAWSDLPTSAVFLPLVRELLTRRRQSSSGVLRAACGEPLPRLANLAGDAIAAAGDLTTDEPEVLVLGQTPVEINVSRRESDLGQRSLLALRDQLTEARTSDSREARTKPVTAGMRRPVELWPWLAAAAAGGAGLRLC